MRAAIFQSATAGMTPSQRIAALADAVNTVNVDLLLCPELFLSGYAAGDDIVRHAEPMDGAGATSIADLARQTRTAIVYGYPEQADGVLYNSAQCLGPDGERLANHRKQVLPPGFEASHFASPRSGLSTFELGGVRFAILICYEIEFPEAARAAAQAGAHVILAPTALAAHWTVVAHKLIPARAFENGVYLLYANHAGSEGGFGYLGGSCIVGPDGKDLARAGEDAAIIWGDLDISRLAAVRSRLPYLRDLPALEGLKRKP